MGYSSSDDPDSVLSERYSFLHILMDQPRSKSELEEVVDVSRSTLDRALRDLADSEFVVYKDGVWKPTPLGRCSYRAREAYLGRLESLVEAGPLINELSTTDMIDYPFLEGASVNRADPSMPDAIIQLLLDSVETGKYITIITPVVITGFAEELYERVRSTEDYSLDLIIPPDVFERMRAVFSSLTNKLQDDSNVSLHTATMPFSFGLWIVDSSEAGVIIFTEQGVRGILMNDTPDALDWAEDQYNRVKQEANSDFL
ncbi:hypothetical protein C471_09645 [Halorubrum saccharovorum DSM 1137]|nr:transcriptional regulator [Halorubrum saccharovorum]ELZ38215.1 hypothetical protein C471_09645 [Halorubrum saccharovorum DSM 1137]